MPKVASAALIYAGGEDADIICASSGSCTTANDTRYYRTAWARSAIQVSTANTDPPSSRFATQPFAASTEIWAHGWVCISDYGNCTWLNNKNGLQLIRVMDDAGNPTLVVRGTGTSGTLKISSRTAAGAYTDLVTCPTAIAAHLWQVDLHVNYGTSGEVSLFRDGVQVCDYTGDVTNGDGATTLEQVEFSSITDERAALWSEIIVATTDTRAMSRYSANTVGNGNTTGFSGTNVCSSIWNALAYNDANYGYSGSANVVHECTVSSSIPPGSYQVLGLVMNTRALVGTTGPQHFDFITRVNGTDYASSDFAPLPTFSNLGNYIQTTNPDTGLAWAVSDFAAAGFNVGLETKP
jgi:hypothetical protein